MNQPRLYLASLFALFIKANCSGCDRALSRKARKILNELVFSDIETSPSQLPWDCPFNPIHDLFFTQEQSKQTIHNTQWKCSVCGKLFKSEFYLDRHFDRKHEDMLTQEAAVCLADFCDVLGCEGPSHIHGNSVVLGGGCRESEMAVQRMRCQATFHKCFPERLGEIPELYYNAFNEQICERLSCAKAERKDFLDNLAGNIMSTVDAPPPFSSDSIRFGFGAVFVVILIIYYGYLFHHKWKASFKENLQTVVTPRSRTRGRKLD